MNKRIRSIENKIKKILTPLFENIIDMQKWNEHPQKLEWKGWNNEEKKEDENIVKKTK